MTHERPTPEAVRASLAQRIERVHRSPRLAAVADWVRGLDDVRLAEEAAMVEAALATDRGRARESLTVIADHFLGPPTLPVDVRVELVRRVTTRALTPGNLRKTLAAIAAAEPSARRALLDELRRPAVDLSQVHTVLVAAFRAAPPGVLVPPFHRGQPIPMLGSGDYEALARRMSDASFRLPASPEIFPSAASLALVATRAVKLLFARDGADEVRRFAAMVDDELLRLDVVNALRARKVVPSRPVRRALWRGPHGKVRCWLAELDGGSCGLLAKLGARYAWTEGARDEMLATLPDDCFEAAARALA